MSRQAANFKGCSFPGCAKPHCAKGYCNTHWAQQRRYGKQWPITTNETPEDRFERNIKKDSETGCWNWMGAGSGKFYDKESGKGGYGQLRVKGQGWMAHRWAYVHFKNRPLQDYEYLDHKCRNTRCCNPDHLEIVSRHENNKRAHLYRALRGENEHLKKRLKQAVSVMQSFIKEKNIANISSLRLFCEECEVPRPEEDL